MLVPWPLGPVQSSDVSASLKPFAIPAPHFVWLAAWHWPGLQASCGFSCGLLEVKTEMLVALTKLCGESGTHWQLLATPRALTLYGATKEMQHGTILLDFPRCCELISTSTFALTGEIGDLPWTGLTLCSVSGILFSTRTSYKASSR